MNYEFIVSEMPSPTSYDPLEADYSNNLHASQMIHRSLLEVSADNTLTSGVLKTFTYNPSTSEIELVVNNQATFSDGSSITAKDIEMTIKRMGARRPKFPVLRHIVGIGNWAAKVDPLNHPLEGIEVDGDIVRIRLAKKINNPLFRFALPLYGVVKHQCLDLKSNKLQADCPTSGFYKLVTAKDDRLTFEVNKIYSQNSLPGKIDLRYWGRPLTGQDLESLKEGSFVAFTEEYGLDGNQISQQESLGFHRLQQPYSRISAFLLNPNVDLFSKVECRQIFSDELRHNLEETMPQGLMESSVFNQIVPGYLTSSDLKKTRPLKTQAQDCRKMMKGKMLKWMPLSSHTNNVAFDSALEKTAKSLGIQIVRLPETSRKERFDAFVNNQLDVLMLATGFWPFDPVGDIQMLFTPGLHQQLLHSSSDNELQKMLENLEFEENPAPRLAEINRYLYREAKFNVYAHSKRVYLAKGDGTKADIPIAITPPAPWQVFNVGNR